ncbi:pyrroline-5-carboxylate reductase [Caminicella sporogenes]|uniref:pyrroline-5-carboxylate reductase n=1 Tax=Caminicella sporogenes TaxID=166485 RepID=UPI00254215BE|nr:pyrroline-5-carboxylate reductase [Caminicella sporogenes]WIF94019.1 pyrroline-5-carboxylate reductase [Caminicella sporogenes]
MNKKVGIIGCGNMASAIIGGIIQSKLISPENVIVSDRDYAKLELISKKYGIKITKDNTEVANFSDILILAVKPYIHDVILEEIKNNVKSDTVVVTIAAGIDINYIETKLGQTVKVIRTMPNTPALVRQGMSALCANKNVTNKELENAVKIFESFGKVEIIDEKLMDFIPAISGSSPAYVFMFIEALADGGVASGVPRDKAYKMAAQAVLGAAQMVLETGKHPGELKDMVCTPGGTTIEAVSSLERNNFRGAVIEAVKACNDKAVSMLKK